MFNNIVPKIPAVYIVILCFIGQILTSAIMDYIYLDIYSKGKVICGVLFLIGFIFKAEVDNKYELGNLKLSENVELLNSLRIIKNLYVIIIKNNYLRRLIMKYEIIIFDADETLFDFKKTEREALKNTILEFDIEYDEKHHLKVYQEINTAIWKEFEEGLITQKKLKIERFIRLSDRLNIEFDEIEFTKLFMKHLSYASFLYDDSINLVESLNKDYRLTIITNGLKDVQDNRIRKSIIAKYFEDIVVSEEVEVSKPDPKIFEHALNNIKHSDKSNVLIVGDSLTSDIQGGINFGIDTCWFNPNMSVNKTGIKPTYEISNLMELKDVLEK